MKSKNKSHIVAYIVGTLVIYGLLKLESFIYRLRNESYDEEINELAETWHFRYKNVKLGEGSCYYQKAWRRTLL